MPQPWTISIAGFDGQKFATRYGLDSLRDFFCQPIDATTQRLFLRQGVTIPDDPPIIDAPDSAAIVERKRAVLSVDSPRAENKLLRAVGAVLVDELNLHADKINAGTVD